MGFIFYSDQQLLWLRHCKFKFGLVLMAQVSHNNLDAVHCEIKFELS